MRKLLYRFVVLMMVPLASCVDAPSRPPERLDLLIYSPWHGMRVVELRRSGPSQYETAARDGEPARGNLSVTNAQFDELATALQQFEARSLPIAAPNALERGRCAAGEQLVTDAGGMSIAWHRGNDVRIASIPFGCDEGRYAERNRRLRAVFDDLGVPAFPSPDQRQ